MRGALLRLKWISMTKTQRTVLTALPLISCCSPIAMAEISGSAESSFHQSLQGESIYGTETISGSDMLREYQYRTIEENTPVLDTDIPVRNGRIDGPRITVRKFNFHRLQDFPDNGITKENVEKFAENLRIKYMKEDQIFSNGYTRDNLEELAGYLNDVGARESVANLNSENLLKLIDIIKRQNEERGIGYADLEEISNELTRYYRQHGLFLAQVKIPAQEVSDGVVTFSVHEGVLGKVMVENNHNYSQKVLSKPFDRDVGGLVSHEKMEEGLYLLNDLPGLDVTGYFTAGDNPGETALNLRVRNEQSWKIAVRSDNHGSRFTGDKRTYVVGEWFNPVGVGDSLTLGYLKSADPGNTDLYQASYRFPVFGPRTHLETSAEKNQFKLEDNDGGETSVINLLEMEGVNESYALGLEHKFYRSRDFNFSTGLKLTDKSTEINSVDSIYDQKERVRGGEISFYVDDLAKTIRMFNVASIRMAYGEHQLDMPAEQGDHFEKVSIDTNSLFFVPLPFTDADSRLVLKSRWQYSEQSLPSFEQISLGGAHGVRAFTVRDFSADQVGIVSAEWYFDMPQFMNFEIHEGHYFNDVFQFGLIADSAYGRLVNFEDDVTDSWAYLASYGLIMKVNWDAAFSSQFTFSRPSASKSSVQGIGDEAESVQVYADFTFNF